MEGMVHFLAFVIIQSSILIFGNEITANRAHNSSNNKQLNLNGSSINDSDNATSILRYGFHKTHDCQDFHKAYMCIKTCLERGYQVATSDRLCVCTCHKNKDKINWFVSMYPTRSFSIPTTRKPVWDGSNNQNVPGGEIIDMSNESSNGSSKEHNDSHLYYTDSEYYTDDDNSTDTGDERSPDDEGSGESEDGGDNKKDEGGKSDGGDTTESEESGDGEGTAEAAEPETSVSD